MIKVYFKFKAYCFRKWLKEQAVSTKRVTFWWELYSVLFFVFVVFYLIGGKIMYLQSAVVSLILMVIISVGKDYNSGRHVHWYRSNVYGKEKVKDNSR